LNENERREGICLGLIGGLGVGATVYYYRELVKAHAAHAFVPNLLIVHADVNRVLKYAATNDIARMAEYFLVLMRRLEAAGAKVAAIPAITPHLCEPELRPRSPIPLVSLVDEIVGEVGRREFRRVALFGTRFTIETGLFGRLKAVDVVAPTTAEIEFIHQAYLQIVNAGSGSEEQYQGLRQVAHTLIERENVEAIILAGTELALIFNEANLDFPHIDGSRLHLDAIMRQLTTPDRGQ
jgi:aspartate racemase